MGQSLAEHGILALKTSSVLCLWIQPGFNRKTMLKRDQEAKIPTSVQHILTLTGKDFQFIEYRNLKQRHSEGSYGWQIFNPVESLAQQKTDPV